MEKLQNASRDRRDVVEGGATEEGAKAETGDKTKWATSLRVAGAKIPEQI